MERDHAEISHKYQTKCDELEWTQKRYRTIKDDYNQLFHQLKEVKNIEKNKEATINSMELSFKKMKASYL